MTWSRWVFDAVEVDRKLAAAHTLNTLALTANKVVFDLYDHCPLVSRFFIIESNGASLAVNVRGDRQLASDRRAHRTRAIASGRLQVETMLRPAGFSLVGAPLHDGDDVTGVLEFVVPTEMLKPKEDRLALVARAASSALRAWRTATLAQLEASQAAGTSFALGLRLAGVLTQAGELGAATRSAVQLLARELKAPVVAWRTEPSGHALGWARRAGSAAAIGQRSSRRLHQCRSAPTAHGRCAICALGLLRSSAAM